MGSTARSSTLFAATDHVLSTRDISLEDRKAIGYFPAPLCHIGFPIKRLVDPVTKKNLSEWAHRSGDHRLSINSPSDFGVPFGNFPRFAIAWMSTEAKRLYKAEKDSTTLHLGSSYSKWLQLVNPVKGVSGGENGNLTRFRRSYIALASSTIHYSYLPEGTDRGPRIGPINYQIAKNMLWHPALTLVGAEQVAFNSSLVLGELFHWDIINRGFPFELAVLRVLRANPAAIDIYLWATYRAGGQTRRETLEVAPQKTRVLQISWDSLRLQFGAGYSKDMHLYQFKRRFLKNCFLVHLVYSKFNVVDKGEKAVFTLIGTSVQQKRRTTPELPTPLFA